MSDNVVRRIVPVWQRLSAFFGRRPIQVLCYLTAMVIVTVLLSTALVRASQNAADIQEIKYNFCQTGAEYTTKQKQQCGELLDRLLTNPTPEQAERLREIIRSAK